MKTLSLAKSLATAISVAALMFTGSIAAQDAQSAVAGRPRVGFSIVKTSKVAVAERLLIPGGSYSKKIDTNFSAFLIKHDQDYLLFDTGLGTKIDAQYEQDMPYWQRPFFKFDRPVVPARKQLDDATFPRPAFLPRRTR